MSHVYKILTLEEWDKFSKEGVFSGNKMDIKDGYIHMSSNEEQYLRVLNKYYSDQEQVIILHINKQNISNLRMEPIKNGDLYPHQYGDLQLEWCDLIQYCNIE